MYICGYVGGGILFTGCKRDAHASRIGCPSTRALSLSHTKYFGVRQARMMPAARRKGVPIVAAGYSLLCAFGGPKRGLMRVTRN